MQIGSTDPMVRITNYTYAGVFPFKFPGQFYMSQDSALINIDGCIFSSCVKLLVIIFYMYCLIYVDFRANPYEAICSSVDLSNQAEIQRLTGM